MASQSLWARFTNLIHRYVDIVPKVVEHFVGMLREPDNKTPSSARTLGCFLFMAVLVVQVKIVWTLCSMIVHLDPTLPNAAALLATYTKVLYIVLMWTILFDVAAALSLYGINVWRYVAAIRCGSIPKDDAEDSKKDETQQVAPPPGPVE